MKEKWSGKKQQLKDKTLFLALLAGCFDIFEGEGSTGDC